MDEPKKDSTEETLEQPSTTVKPAAGGGPQVIQATTAGGDDDSTLSGDGSSAAAAPVPQTQTPGRAGGPLAVLTGLNIYALGFILVLIIAAATGTILYLRAKTDSDTQNSLNSQQLSQSTLDQLANSDVTVGEPKHTLNVQSNAIFTGAVLVRSNLTIAGTLQVGSSLAINGIRVTGQSTFDDVQVTKSLAVTGNVSMQGQLNIQQSLNVNGSANFLGAVSAPSITTGGLQISGDLSLTHHISAGGPTPSRSNGTALGGGGTVSVSGSDTAGTITINTGSSPVAGCFLTVTFATKFNSTPHLVIYTLSAPRQTLASAR